MTLFWSIAGLFMAAALLFILPPLLRNQRKQAGVAGEVREAMNVSVYRDQFAELDADLRNGILSQEQYDQGKQELQQRLLQDVPRQRTEDRGQRTEDRGQRTEDRGQRAAR